VWRGALREKQVRNFHGIALVAVHARSFEPHALVLDHGDYACLWRLAQECTHSPQVASSLAEFGRNLHEYEAAMAGSMEVSP
jgi:hypothetical protein